MRTRYGLPWIEPAKLGRPRWTHANPLRPSEAEEIYEALRDYSGTTVAVNLAPQSIFSIPIGGAYTPTGGVAFQKTRYHTNMKQARQLPNPNKFQLEGMAIQLHPDTNPADAKAFLAQELVTLTIGDTDKRYIELQPMFIPGAGGVHIAGPMFQAVAADFGAVAVGNGWPVARNVHVLGEDVASGAQIIEQGQDFGVTEDPFADTSDALYGTAAAVNVGQLPGTGIRVFYMLLGHWLRGVQ